jgi:hypothetical protein
MARVPAPWIIDEVERARRQRVEHEQPRPRPEIPRAPDRPRSLDDAPPPSMVVVIDWNTAGSPGDR